MVHRLLFGQSGQTLHFTPARRQALSWVLEDLTVPEQGAERILAQGDLEAPAGDIETTQDSGPGTPFRDRVFASSSADVGEMLRITSAETGTSELFTVAGVRVGQYLTTLVPLTTRYPVGSTVDRLRVTTEPLPDDVTNDRERLQQREPMRVVWSLDDGSRHQEQVYLLRADHGDLDTAKVLQTVTRLFPDVQTRFEHHDKDMLEGMVDACADAMSAQLSARGIPSASGFLLGDQGRFALAFKVLLHLAALGNRPGNDDAQRWDAYLEREYEGAIAGLFTGQDGAETQRPDPVTDTVAPQRPFKRHMVGM